MQHIAMYHLLMIIQNKGQATPSRNNVPTEIAFILKATPSSLGAKLFPVDENISFQKF